MKIEESITLKVDETGKLEIAERNDPDSKTKIKEFSTPDSNGIAFGRLFGDLKEGDIVILTFKNVRIFPHCGQKLRVK